MIIFHVRLTNGATQDLFNIQNYLTIVTGDPAAASRIVKDIHEQLSALSIFPYRYEEIAVEPWHSRHARRMPIGKYIAIYQVLDNMDEVHIMHIVSMRSDALDIAKTWKS